MRLHWIANTRHKEQGETVEEPLDPRLDAYFATLGVRHFLPDGWTVDAQLPVGLVQYDRGTGQGTSRVSGFGDLQLGLRYDLSQLWGAGAYLPTVTVRGALGLPTGQQIQSDPTANVAPSMLATGFATFSAQGRVAITQFITRWLAWQGAGWVAAPLGRTENGLRPGVQVGYQLGVLTRPLPELALSARVEGRWTARADDEPVGEILRSGGRDLAVAVDVGWRANDRLTLTAGGRVPFYQWVNRRQVVETFTLGVGCAVTFGLEDEDEDAHDHGHEDAHDHGHEDAHDHGHEDAHDHGHEDGDDHDHGGATADVADLTRGGESFDAARLPVPGKITVVDFWADWCKPCVELGHTLAKMAASHPELAVRKVEVPDFDTPVAEAHLVGVQALPTVWIVFPDGRREVLAGKPVPEILRAVRAALKGEPKPPHAH